jgi:hypothetical protein
MPGPIFPPWLRRGLEVALVAAIVAIASLWGDRLDAGGAAFPLPSGPPAALLLAPAVLAVSVLPVTYAVAMAATRGDALMGAVAGFLVAVDLVIVFTGARVSMDRLGLTLPGGVLVGLLALAPALAGLVGSQVGASFGFGRRAGAVAAVASALTGAVVLLVVALIT